MAAEEVEADFFERHVACVARDLIGRCLRIAHDDGDVHAMIVETEAYGNATDPASHAAFRPGGRAAQMAHAAGTVYVYLAYGMYPCFNIVTGPVGEASAVLIRGVQRTDDEKPVHGPGRTTRLLGITADDHGLQIPGRRFGISGARKDLSIDQTPRIGISRAIEREWRFVAATQN